MLYKMTYVGILSIYSNLYFFIDFIISGIPLASYIVMSTNNNKKETKMSKKYENDIDYKGHNIVVWNDNGNRIFAIGTKEFPHMPFAKEYIDKIHQKNDAYQDEEGVWRWKTNDRVPFKDMLECWGLDEETMQKCIAARKKDTSAFLSKYRKQMENYVPSAEEKFEMQAAFGEGAEVVNVITGKKIQL